MKSTILIDSCSDLPISYINTNNVEVVNFSYLLKDKHYKDDFGCTMPYKEFYSAIRDGEKSLTSQINVYEYEHRFTNLINKGQDIVYICFSSALSGSFMSAQIAKENILEEYPNANIYIIDSRCVSLGEGLLCHYIIELAKNGESANDIYKWAEQNKMKINHFFILSDLNHLKRGGRISATIGTMLNVKTMITVDREGRLKLINRTRGRKKSLTSLIKIFEERVQKPENQTIAISHGDCEEDAFYLENLIRNQYNVSDVIINNMGPVIGSHAGYGSVGLFFIGKERE